MKNRYIVIFIVMIVVWLTCNNKKSIISKRDFTITAFTTFNNLFLDSVTLEVFLDKHEEFKAYKSQYLNFYKERNYEYTWFDSSGLAEQAHNFMNLLNNAITELNDSSLYNSALYKLYESFAIDSGYHQQNDQVAQAELLFTGQFFVYAAKVFKGSEVDASALGWYIPRKKVNLATLLDSSLKTKGLGLDLPISAAYKQLQAYLIKYIELDKQIADKWDSIPAPIKLGLKKGDSSMIIVQIKKRLHLLGDMQLIDSSTKFDSVLYVSVQQFEQRNGLNADGVISMSVVKELNVPVKQRIQQILVNLERLRWMPIQRGDNFVVVNIPEYKMHVYDSNHQVLEMKVIVGKASTNTTIFNANLKYIVFSPYWNVPTSIVQKEILPAMKRNSSYLSKNNMEIIGMNAGIPEIRQKPGPNNSLGLIKFLFPNNYNIYLHDTPNRELFNAAMRTFSHGCIRIAEPKKFAQYLLSADTSMIYTSKVIDSLMHLTKEKWVTLKKAIPVYVVYFTAWVDKAGLLNFRKDIYGHDAKMSAKLFVTK